jgi:hypothetical protein
LQKVLSPDPFSKTLAAALSRESAFSISGKSAFSGEILSLRKAETTRPFLGA